MEFVTRKILNAAGEIVADSSVSITSDILLKGYKTMVLTRHMDERMITLQRQGAITFAMSSKGEEACAVAGAAALNMNDWIYPQYRESGVMFWRGATPLQYIHQMFGDAEDLGLGRQMPNHFGDRKLNIVTVSSPIGTKIPHAAGCGYAMKLQKEDAVAVCYFGEGATSEGDFHVGLTFAAVRKAPVIFFCRNNGYAISTPAISQFATDGVAPQGPGHGIKTYRVDGNDFMAIYETVAQARAYTTSVKGPVFIEAMTYRMGAHSTSDDPTRYRPENEAQKWEDADPILRLRRYLEKNHLWDQKQEDALQESVQRQITEAIAVAKQTSKPPLRTLVEGVYAQVPEYLEEQFEKTKRFYGDQE
jgi:2-oxoisovalerate dehydrogenase E1 component alpha subunit